MPVVDCLKLKFLAEQIDGKYIKENTIKVDIASDIAIVFFEFFWINIKKLYWMKYLCIFWNKIIVILGESILCFTPKVHLYMYDMYGSTLFNILLTYLQ